VQNVSTAPTPATADQKQVGIAVGIIGVLVSLFMAGTVTFLSYYHSVFYVAGH
jgi:hypothetical protein